MVQNGIFHYYFFIDIFKQNNIQISQYSILFSVYKDIDFCIDSLQIWYEYVKQYKVCCGWWWVSNMY